MSDTDGNDFTLDGLRTVINEKYKPVKIGLGEGISVRLLQTARLPESKQDELMGMQTQFNDLQKQGAALNSAARDVTVEQVAAWRDEFATTNGRLPTDDEVDSWKKAEGSREVTLDEVKAFKAKTVATLENMLRTVAASESEGERIVAACNHDELLLMEVFQNYSKKTKLGEASASQDSSGSTAGPSGQTSASTTD